MKQNRWLLCWVLVLPALVLGCRSKPAPPAPFDVLARHVPAGVEQVFFSNLKLPDRTERHWERIQQRLGTNLSELLLGIRDPFKAQEYGLQDFIVGPVAQWFGAQGSCAILQVTNKRAVERVLRQLPPNIGWQEIDVNGHKVYEGLDPALASRRLAWTLHDGLLFLAFGQGIRRAALQEVLDLEPEYSLAESTLWRRLRDWLPEDPPGLVFMNTAASMPADPLPSEKEQPDLLLGRQIPALAMAIVPEEKGLRIEIAGAAVLREDAPPEVRELFALPAVDPSAWDGMPADTSLALVAHDIHLLWPWAKIMFGLGPLEPVREGIGLDLEADLMGAEGPLAEDFCLAIMPPLSTQPIIQGLPAAQLLFAAQGVPEARAQELRAAMESRGATFGAATVEGVGLQVQAGTGASGYAVSYGADDNTVLLGASPEAIGRWVAARREGSGLVQSETFQHVLTALPDDPSVFFYVNAPLMANILKANMAGEQYQSEGYEVLLEGLDAIGLGIRLKPDMVDGVLYLYLP